MLKNITTTFMLLGSALSPLCAQTWEGLATDNNWSSSSNWSGGIPVNDGTADLIFGAGERPNPTVDSAYDINSFTFDATAGLYSFSGNPLTIQGGGIINNDADVQSFTNNITLGAAQTWDAQAGDLSFTGTVGLGTNNLTLSGPEAFFFTNVISGSGNIAIRDGADVLMTAVNTYSGPTTVSAGNSGGLLEFNSASQIPSGNININQRGTFRLLDQGGSTVTFNN